MVSSLGKAVPQRAQRAARPVRSNDQISASAGRVHCIAIGRSLRQNTFPTPDAKCSGRRFDCPIVQSRETMDPLDDVFAAMRVQSALYARLETTAPWGINFAGGTGARF